MTTFDFVFMLTRNDATVQDAARQLDTALKAGLRHIGFKDIGLPFSELGSLTQTIRDHGALSYLEVVSLDRDREIASVHAAIRLDVDHLLGGTHVEDVLPIIAGSAIRYFPFPGRISGHPSVLEGSIDDIVASAGAHAGLEGVAGLDLLAYRSTTDVPELVRQVCAAVDKPVIVAGSVDTPDKIRTIRDSGASGFTIGTAALDGVFPAEDRTLEAQLRAILRVAETATSTSKTEDI